MPRYMNGEQSAAFRAVVKRDYPEYTDPVRGTVHPAHVSTTYYGPYANIGVAKGAITRQKRPTWWDVRTGATITAWVEKSSVVWEVVA